MTEDWTKWEGLIIDGVFPLRRYLGRSDHSVVFLTEYAAHNLPDAAIKLIPADPVLAEAQLSCWTIAGALSHPHLIRIFGSGRCWLGGHPFLYVVMEYADQTLAQLLPHRALTPDEARELLLPTLEALAFLHGKNLVQGQLKPPNVLVVDDRVKLASDTVRPAGDSVSGIGAAIPVRCSRSERWQDFRRRRCVGSRRHHRRGSDPASSRLARCAARKCFLARRSSSAICGHRTTLLEPLSRRPSLDRGSGSPNKTGGARARGCGY